MHQTADDSRRYSVHQQEISLNDGQKSAKLKQTLIILALISLLSRIVYTTYATWLTVHQFNCIPCVNSSSNSSSHSSSSLFINQHASFKLISKGFNGLTNQNEDVKLRDKREAHIRIKRMAEAKMDKRMAETKMDKREAHIRNKRMAEAKMDKREAHIRNKRITEVKMDNLSKEELSVPFNVPENFQHSKGVQMKGKKYFCRKFILLSFFRNTKWNN